MTEKQSDALKDELLKVFQNNRLSRAMSIMVNRGFKLENPGFLDAEDITEVERLGLVVDTELVMLQPASEALIDGSYDILVFNVSRGDFKCVIKVANMACGFAGVE